ncbi:phage/plasmid replication protein, II/X family [Colwellia sp. E2M01]|uniref:phage/plasmid replication protein, II/X family n=1 Tax=Colwellia sp. E2M01 TaxID=2841561 RepID=UPI001C091093|nr:phage/plasmid replication protein, II/X family [Colwellia sp. E2M01]MBU2871528.1 phage/plasmid replication protein, II/X family [Colwellia sp. E2M01]
MIDLFRLSIPFNEDFCSGDAAESRGIVDLQACHWSGAKLEAGEVEYTPCGAVTVSRLRHPFESIASSNSTLSFKIFTGGDNYWPHIELKASPAKLLQGHNVYGSCDVEKCVFALVQAFNVGMPDLSNMLDWHLCEIKQIDVTFTAQLENMTQGRQVITALKNISSGQTRSSKNNHDTTCYFGINSNGKKSSRHKQLKIYLKHFELMHQISELEKKIKRNPNPLYIKQLEAMTNDQVKLFAENALRFEASILPRMLQRLAIPTLANEFIEYAQNFKSCLIQSLWSEAFKDVFNALGDESMNAYDDESILNKLKSIYSKVSVTTGNVSYAKAERLFRFYRSFKNEGFEEVKRTTPEKTFYRNMKELCVVVSRAHLQNLKGIASNVVPMLRVINVDFSNQHPSSYKEPDHLCDQVQLRAVS